jgi:hypothetical protein
MQRIHGILIAAALGAATTACDDSSTNPAGAQRVLGALQLETAATAAARAAAEAGGDDPVKWSVPPGGHGTVTAPRPIEAPDSVRVGERFQVTVHTIGENACWRADGQDVRVEGSVATIVPWDAHSGAEMCAEVLGHLAHRVDVTFAAPGQATIRVNGRRVRQADRTWEQPVSAERTVVVR